MINILGTKSSRYALITYGDESDVKVNFNHLTEDHSETEILAGIDQIAHKDGTKQ